MTASNSIITITIPLEETPANQEAHDSTNLPNGEIVDSGHSSPQPDTLLNELIYTLLLRENVSAADLSVDDAEAILASQFQIAAEAQR